MYSLINKINKKQILNFNDIEFISRYTKKHINNEKILNRIIIILNKDIKLRKEKFNIDCIKELKKEKLLLPKKSKPNNEYTRLNKEIGEKFIKREIKYNEYEQKMKEYDINFLKTSTIIK
jgi:hypothetical protein